MSKVIIKSPEQIEGVRNSARLAAQTLDYLTPKVEAGVTTQEINDLAHEFIINHRAKPAPLGYRGYPKSICTSLNNVVCHGIPSPEDVLQSGDILNIDVTTILDGYYGDTSRMFIIGSAAPKAEKLVQRTKEALEKAIAQVKPGRYLNEAVGQTIEKYIKTFGYASVRNLTGHGVGLEFHEPPSVFHYDRRENQVQLKPGMVFTIEPMINNSRNHQVTTDPDDGWTIYTRDGALSAQWEHTILVTGNGHEVLTQPQDV